MRMPISIPATRVMDVEKVWLTRKDAAKYLGVSVDFIKKLCLDMRLPWYKVSATPYTTAPMPYIHEYIFAISHFQFSLSQPKILAISLSSSALDFPGLILFSSFSEVSVSNQPFL